MWISVCKFCLGEKHFRNLSDSYIRLVDSIVPLMQSLLFQIKIAMKQMSPKSQTGREKMSEKLWQGDANPSLMTWNWRKQPEAISAPSSNRMNHRQLSKKARNLCKDRGNLLEIWAESITVQMFMCWSLFSEHWARHKGGITKKE